MDEDDAGDERDTGQHANEQRSRAAVRPPASPHPPKGHDERNDHQWPQERIRAVETGGCPHAAVRDDISHNLVMLERLMAEFHPDLMFVESGGES